ncbi:MAG: Tryptophan-tRNA ligase [Parcubacteria group bacterium GW2011_GWF2_38_76]|nr:MAG: Tryptophan-tRNA ligase [Parcubacteria group bacterium GW2011_GWF2_38_76]HBM46037.1 tryptophan--tRNA ligase [Patescibacteria group bacterium]
MTQNKGKQIALTGDRPTGRLHLGHYVGSLKNRVKMQDEFKQFVMVADVQALTDNADNPDKVRNNVLEVALDNLAVGVDPAKTTFFIQSMVPEIAELTIFFLNLVTVARLERNPTVKNEMRQKGFEGNVPAGFLAYPVSQAADILTFKATHVPVGDDQLPVLEQANEIAHKFNSLYGDTFEKIEPIMSHAPRLVGIDGDAKMSKSLNNAIFLSDDTETIKKKVMQMYTDPKHIHVGDPGEVEGNVVFEYLTIFDPKQDEINDLKEQYRKGGLGDTVIKNRLIDVLENIIAPIREKREYLSAKPDYVMNILLEGTKEARKVATETMNEVKKAMKINY